MATFTVTLVSPLAGDIREVAGKLCLIVTEAGKYASNQVLLVGSREELAGFTRAMLDLLEAEEEEQAS